MRSAAEFAVAAGLLTLIPGPDTLLTLRTAVAVGRSQATAAAMGIGTALLGWGAAAGLGLTAALAASPAAYTALRWIGAGYLAFLGVRTIVAGSYWPADQERIGQPRSDRVWPAYLRGLITCASNPKVGVFYLALFPQFIPPGAHVLRYSVMLAGIHAVETLAWLLAVAALAAGFGRILHRQRTRRWADRVSGAAFLAFAARLAGGG